MPAPTFMAIVPKDLDSRVRKAVAFYWRTLENQSKKQRKKGAKAVDRGGRAGATGGKQMDGFASLIREILIENKLNDTSVHLHKKLELPGFFRATKKWDLVVVQDSKLIVAMELKSHTAPSFGKNLNNRAEESVGTAQDFRTAFREGAFHVGEKPWIGTLMLLEDCPDIKKNRGVKQPHFNVFPEFKDASYAKRYELLFRKLVREELYTRAALLLSTKSEGVRGDFNEPATDLGVREFFISLAGHIATFRASQS